MEAHILRMSQILNVKYNITHKLLLQRTAPRERSCGWWWRKLREKYCLSFSDDMSGGDQNISRIFHKCWSLTKNIKDAPHSLSMQILKVNKARRVITDFTVSNYSSLPRMKNHFMTNGIIKLMARSLAVISVESHEIDTTCAKCFHGENGTDWIQCPRCSQWFHKNCFYVWCGIFETSFYVSSCALFCSYNICVRWTSDIFF